MARATRAVQEGTEALARQDPVLAAMVDQHGPPILRRRAPRPSYFASLARAVCYQQLAGRAAATIHGRFAALFDVEPTPEAVLAVPEESLRAAGLSCNKAASIRDLAEKSLDGTVELDRMARLDDDAVIGELVQVRGIGEWTAHMFLMFDLGRLDVWPTGDYGVRNGYARLYDLDELPTPKALGGLGDRFRPYRSLVAWYCWRAVDTATPG